VISSFPTLYESGWFRILFFLVFFPLKSHAALVFNEILYNPASGDQDEEFIEIFNSGPSGIDLTHWAIRGGIDFDFPSSLSLAPGAYLVVAKSLPAFEARYPGSTAQVVGGYSRKLDNGGETLRLLRPDLGVEDSVSYDDDPPWPVEADGEGSSLELRNPALDNTFPDAWGAGVTGGTPGLQNSVFEVNPAPLVKILHHSPTVPASGRPITFAVQALDNGEVANVSLFYQMAPRVKSASGEKAFRSVRLFDDGAHGDGSASDGVFGGSLPGFSDGAVLEFYATARDDTGKVSRFPSAAPNENCLLLVDNAAHSNSVPLYRIVLTPRDLDELESRDLFSNDLLNCTFIAGDAIHYRNGIRYRGSTSRFISDRRSYRIEFSAENAFEGVLELNLNGLSVANQILGWEVFESMGAPVPSRRPVQVVLNGEFLGPYLQIESVEKDYLTHNFPGNDEGNLYRGEGMADLAYRGEDPALYETDYVKQTNRTENDYRDIIDLVRRFYLSNEAEFPGQISSGIDVEQWLRFFALHTLLANEEGGVYRDTGDDYFLYRRPSDDRFVILAWDLDSVFLNPYEPPFRPTLPSVVRLIRHPLFVRRYYLYLEEALNGPFAQEAMAERVNRYRGYLPDEDLDRILNFVPERKSHLELAIPQELTIEILTPAEGCNIFLLSDNQVRLGGKANAAHTLEVRVNGETAAWDPYTARWEGVFPLSRGRNDFVIETIDDTGSIGESRFLPLVQGQSLVGGFLQEDRNWTPEGNPYRITEDLVVPPGKVLSIEAGTTVFLEPGVSIHVEGSLVVTGRPGAPVSFAAWDCEPWGGIVVQSSTEAVSFEHCVFEKALGPKAQGSLAPACVSAMASTVKIDNCVFRNLPARAISVTASQLWSDGCEIVAASGGIEAVDSFCWISGATLRDTTGMAPSMQFGGGQGSASIVRDCVIEGGKVAGISIESDPTRVDRCQISGVEGPAIAIHGSGHTDLTRNLLHRCTVGIRLTNGASPLIDHQTIVHNEIGVEGETAAAGIASATAKIVSTILWENDLSIASEILPALQISFSDILGNPVGGEGNIEMDPLFVNPIGGDYRLRPESPCVGTGELGTDMGAFPTDAIGRSLMRLR
jgi:hypothetical protein